MTIADDLLSALDFDDGLPIKQLHRDLQSLQRPASTTEIERTLREIGAVETDGLWVKVRPEPVKETKVKESQRELFV